MVTDLGFSANHSESSVEKIAQAVSLVRRSAEAEAELSVADATWIKLRIFLTALDGAAKCKLESLHDLFCRGRCVALVPVGGVRW